jgi:hypothetical protein
VVPAIVRVGNVRRMGLLYRSIRKSDRGAPSVDLRRLQLCALRGPKRAQGWKGPSEPVARELLSQTGWDKTLPPAHISIIVLWIKAIEWIFLLIGVKQRRMSLGREKWN